MGSSHPSYASVSDAAVELTANDQWTGVPNAPEPWDRRIVLGDPRRSTGSGRLWMVPTCGAI